MKMVNVKAIETFVYGLVIGVCGCYIFEKVYAKKKCKKVFCSCKDKDRN